MIVEVTAAEPILLFACYMVCKGNRDEPKAGWSKEAQSYFQVEVLQSSPCKMTEPTMSPWSLPRPPPPVLDKFSMLPNKSYTYNKISLVSPEDFVVLTFEFVLRFHEAINAPVVVL